MATTWRPWFSVLLGQVGFLDRFTVTMSRHASALAIDDQEAFDATYDPPPSPEQPLPERTNRY